MKSSSEYDVDRIPTIRITFVITLEYIKLNLLTFSMGHSLTIQNPLLMKNFTTHGTWLRQMK